MGEKESRRSFGIFLQAAGCSLNDAQDRQTGHCTISTYRWSSHAADAAGHHDALVREHPAFQALGATASEPQLTYRRLFDTPAAADEVDTIRRYLQRQHALGSSHFMDAIERQLARRVGPAKVAGLETGVKARKLHSDPCFTCNMTGETRFTPRTLAGARPDCVGLASLK